MSSSSRLLQIDGLRGLAIIFVWIWHYVPCQLTGPAAPGSWQSYAKKYLGTTWSGVDLFFVLSGFLIFRLFQQNGVSPAYLKKFFIRRACRILPLYLILLGTFFAFRMLISDPRPYSWLLDTPMPLWSYLTFLQNWIMGFRGDIGARWLGITWSLSVEEQFYLLAPFLFLVSAKTRSISPLFFFYLVSLLLRNTGWFGFHAFPNTFLRLDSLLLGALVSTISSRPNWSKNSQSTPSIALLVSGVLVVTKLFWPRTTFLGWWDQNFFCGIFYASLLNALIIPNSFNWLKSFFSLKTLRFFGRLSYGIYLFHEATSGVLHGLLFSRTPALDTPAQMATTFSSALITLALAFLLNRFIEEPMIRWGRTLSADAQSIEAQPLSATA